MIESYTTGSFYTNSYIISNDQKECVIIDPGLNYKKAAEYIKANYKPKAILLTHGHLDHIDGLMYFLDLPIYIHKLDLDMLNDTETSLYYMIDRVAPFDSNNLDIRIVHDKDKLNLIGYEFNVLHTPGHTNGSCCYQFEKNVFSGDTLFYMSCGRTDFPTGSFEKMEKSLKRIMDTYPDDYKVFPGHNEMTTIGFERKNNPFLK